MHARWTAVTVAVTVLAAAAVVQAIVRLVGSGGWVNGLGAFVGVGLWLWLAAPAWRMSRLTRG
jgi:hypothetical protein